ncbi:hypothetical protein V1264_005080 [Littorina saxatilis]|uniref:PH domain-containing protein n=2 Tax=Littorina saxatilis TaxID=31220 RepID=A0AAN9AZ66_9CAEN
MNISATVVIKEGVMDVLDPQVPSQIWKRQYCVLVKTDILVLKLFNVTQTKLQRTVRLSHCRAALKRNEKGEAVCEISTRQGEVQCLMTWSAERVTYNWLSTLQTQLKGFGTEGPAVECAPPCRTSGSPGNEAVSPAPPLHLSLSVSTSPRPLLSSPLTGAQAGVATSTSHSTGPHPESER